jgi:hypothetical protein
MVIKAMLRGAAKNKNPHEMFNVGADTFFMNEKKLQLTGRRYIKEIRMIPLIITVTYR